MKLAISNIAWPVDQDAAVAEILTASEVGGIEVAPRKIFPNPLEATDAAIDSYRRWWADRGICIVAAQALLFGRPELTLFENAETRRRTRDQLAGIIRLCSRLGAESLVFGSPKNRKVGTLAPETAFAIAVDFFGEIAELAMAAGTQVVMEANPTEYGADFVTTTPQAIELVKAVNHPGFRLHLDTACMMQAKDDPMAVLENEFDLVRHFHASELNLGPVTPVGAVDHAAFAAALRKSGYPHWVSLEMRETEPFTAAGLAESLHFVRKVYSAR